MTAAALETVWRDMRAPLLRFIGGRVSDPGDAEDVLQEVMLRIQRHAGEMDDIEHVGAWVHQVARSTIIDFYRRRAVRPEQAAGTSADVGEFEPAAALDATSAETAQTGLEQCLRPLLQRLPDKYREALELTEFDGVSQTAAAQRLGVSTSGMKARVQRGRSQLRDVLLECCEVELDRRGGVADYHARAGECARCNASRSGSPTAPDAA